MTKKTVAIVKYEKPLASVRKTVEMAKGLNSLSPSMKVFIKPNIVYWTRTTRFHMWGVITTSRVIEDMVILLKERGVENITIGEGMVTFNPKDKKTPSHAFESLGYNVLTRRYGVKCLNLHERPFKKVDIEKGVSLNFNNDILESDFVIDIPVLKTHAQTVVSLGIKNLKGTLDLKSRKKCHSADSKKNLHYMIAKLPRVIQPGLTILDGLYTNERGPGFDGKLRRSNILVASTDMLSADMVGARILGYEVSDVPHLALAARDWGRNGGFSEIKIVGEKTQSVASRHAYAFPYAEDEEGSLPLPMKRMGIKGLSYRKYDLTMCTYCSYLNGRVLAAIAQAWRGHPWDDVEVLTGKAMKTTLGKKKTILLGKCMYQANKNNPHINEMIPVKGCPPSTKDIAKAFHRAGIPLDLAMLENMDTVAELYTKKYAGRPEFDDALFKIRSNPEGVQRGVV